MVPLSFTHTSITMRSFCDNFLQTKKCHKQHLYKYIMKKQCVTAQRIKQEIHCLTMAIQPGQGAWLMICFPFLLFSHHWQHNLLMCFQSRQQALLVLPHHCQTPQWMSQQAFQRHQLKQRWIASPCHHPDTQQRSWGLLPSG